MILSVLKVFFGLVISTDAKTESEYPVVRLFSPESDADVHRGPESDLDNKIHDYFGSLVGSEDTFAYLNSLKTLNTYPGSPTADLYYR